ncbi:class A beta-lactamase-related serine hydrolase [Polymorphobacter arshaanensis]|uniref:Class A beta-lactamase-related serine hydrolase n=1 Tax=Glacieibacterium arshaanense TaxID=2511025 RepID=A0A4Y9EMQ0_9SPHN|nr:serine hydrolase domain-containing protein [Polymorphobacter arshaanensis]TFU03312.1 class A beta-lactamase-related serine hydrolase [Polymorphobacter arshaanensis]
MTIAQALSAASAQHLTPGFVAAASHNGKSLFSQAFGRLAPGTPTPMTEDSIFWLASMTKAVTATAAMQLVEAGKLDLDAPLGNLLPELGRAQVFDGFAADGSVKLRAPKRPITLRHLLTHTSGHVYDMWNADFAKAAKVLGIPSLGTSLNAALNTPLMFDPGTNWEYGIGIDWAGKAVEAASGKALDAYVEDHIAAPLGMVDTSFTPRASWATRHAGMTARAADGSIATIDFATAEDPEFHGGGGGLHGTAHDYLRFLQMVLNGGTLNGAHILKPETVRVMQANHLGDVALRTLTSAAPHLSNDLDLAQGAPAHWGLSWQINPAPGADGRSAGSLAWAGLANCYYWADPATNVAGVLLMQMLPFADAQAMALFGAFERAVYAAVNA